MRVGFDYSPAISHWSGTGRYARELVRALVRMPGAPELRLLEAGLAPRTVPEDALGLDVANRSLRRIRVPVPRRALTALSRCALLSADRLLGGVDLFHRTLFRGPRVSRAMEAVALADLPPANSNEESWVRQSLRSADGVLTMSSAVRDIAIERFSLSPELVHRIAVGADHWKRALGTLPPKAVPPTLIALGRVDGRRAPAALVSAVDVLRRGGVDARLVWVGTAGDGASELLEAVRDRDASRYVAWIAKGEESQLPSLVARAAALVHLSDWEGTSVTPLEAFSLGTPVVASRVPSFVEALGDAACWVDLDSVREDPRVLADAIARCLEQDSRQVGAKRREEIVREFTWERHADLTLGVWREILGRTRS